MVREGAARARKLRIGAAIALASVLFTLVALEGGLRFVLFSELARDRFGYRLRQAGLYTAHESGREHWRLRARLAGAASERPHPSFDERVGWLKRSIDPTTLAHADEPRLGGRVPVLLFGDSYAECVGPPEECWQGLLERSPLGRTHALLNYGVSGYGLDQVYLLMRLVLARREPAPPPVVVVAILVDDDLDRCYLPLRIWPKPCFELDGGELVLRPLEHADAGAYLRDHPVGVRSYLWRLVARNSGLVPAGAVLAGSGEDGYLAEKRELAVRLLRAIEDELDGRGLAHFYVLFHGRRALAAPEYGWQEPLIVATLRELGAPFVSSRRYLGAEEARTGATPASHYLADGPGVNHYTAASNEVVFQALADGLAGRFELATR